MTGDTGNNRPIVVCQKCGLSMTICCCSTGIKPVQDTTPFYAYGWLCPRCGRGNAPFLSTCPCIPIKYDVTCSGVKS